MIIKLLGSGFKNYFNVNQNIFDMAIVTISTVDVLLQFLST